MRSPAVGQRTRSGEHTKPEAIESPVHGDVVIAGSPAAGSNFDVEALCFVAVSGELRRTLIVCLCRRSAPVGRSAARSLRGSRAQFEANCDRLSRSAASGPRPVLHVLVRGVGSDHHVPVFKEIAAPRAGEAFVVGCTERASNQAGSVVTSSTWTRHRSRSPSPTR